MIKQRITCGTCGGFGKHKMLEIVADGYAKWVDIPCGDCDGKGYTEAAVFTPEEAQAILKHCGLATEGDEVSEQ